MKQGFAVEGYIQKDGTVKPLEKYDDTELRERIQINKDDIDNLNSRVRALEDGVVIGDDDAIPGNIASFDEEGLIEDSGYKPSDFASSNHSHNTISLTEIDGSSAKVEAGLDNLTHEGYVEIELKDDQTQEGTTKTAQITMDNFGNLVRALQDPAAPANAGTKLITNGQVYTALEGKMDVFRTILLETEQSGFIISSDGNASIKSFCSSAPENTFVPVKLDLLDDGVDDGSVFGFAKYLFSEQDDLCVEVHINNIVFSTEAESVQSIEDATFTEWTRSFVGHDFFTTA